MDTKHALLLKTLANGPSPVTGKELSQALSVSTRTIQNYVQSINNSYPDKIILATNNGYTINQYAFKKHIHFSNQHIPNNNQERTKYLLNVLLTRNNNIDSFLLEEEMIISHSTLRSVIKDANDYLKPYHLQIKSRKNILCIEGSNNSIQKLIQNMISEDASAKLLESQSLYDYFSKEYVDTIITIVDSLATDFKIKINEFTKTNLILHFCFLFNDETQKYNQNDANDNPFCHSLNEYIFKYFGYYLSNNSIKESILLLQTHSNLGINYDDISIYLDFIQEINKEIEKNYYISLCNEQFNIPFANHIRNLVLRATDHRFYKNPLLEKIKSNAPFIFDISIHISILLKRKFMIEVNEDEIAYIALHIGAEINRQNQTLKSHVLGLYIPQYLDLYNQIKEKIEMNFGNDIQVTEFFTNDNSQSQYDIIVSTFSKNDLKIPNETLFVEISPFLNRNDMDNLFFAIEELKANDTKRILYSNFDLFFHPELFIIDNKRFENEFQTIQELCDDLIIKEYAPSTFKEHVINREKSYPTSFGKIAVPHQFFSKTYKTGIYTIISKDGISWANHKVNLVLLVCVTDEDKKLFSPLYESLLNIYTEDSILKQITQCKTFEEFKSITLSATI